MIALPITFLTLIISLYTKENRDYVTVISVNCRIIKDISHQDHGEVKGLLASSCVRLKLMPHILCRKKDESYDRTEHGAIFSGYKENRSTSKPLFAVSMNL